MVNPFLSETLLKEFFGPGGIGGVQIIQAKRELFGAVFGALRAIRILKDVGEQEEESGRHG